ncbi:hypothetical protein ColTof4_13137 [Colletotrichum tofieldiae]|nr:hypothetical protein ColTof3_00229 [Colletotrichum tofieldiae]GKT80714.1 hypothetical protein ColTof4_13137 [Colletotrichum tofieldiae]GKT88843.1 hypothetical protein Ct61P_06693 [Colletotrichum tofieldiae]
MSNLFGVYKTLMVNVNVKSRTFNEWMKQGKTALAANIRDKLESKSHMVYKSFLIRVYDNQDIWDAHDPQRGTAAGELFTAQAKPDD